MPELYDLTLEAARELLLKREVKVEELVLASLERIRVTEPQVSACLATREEEALELARDMDREGPAPEKILWGLPLSAKDVFCLPGTPTTAGSRMLENYRPTFEATVLTKLREAGAIIVCKTNLDEFAMGSTTEFSAYKPTRNPWNLARVPGGSSGGAAAGVAARQVPGGLGTDTGGSIRQPAAFCGCVGLKPSYGRVSRYGIVAYGSSLDQAGPLTRTVADAGRILSAISGPDGKDSTCSNLPVPDFVNLASRDPRALTLGLPPEFWDGEFDPAVREALDRALAELRDAGVTLKSVSLPRVPYGVATYYILASAEASTNLARYDGVRYGFRASESSELAGLYRDSRSKGLGQEAQRRILLGTFVLSSGYYDAYYKKAAQIRRLIQEDFVKAFGEADFILAPVSSIPPWPFGAFTEDPLTQYQLDVMTVPLNLAGCPGLSLPVGLGADGLPVGVQLWGPSFGEQGLLEAGSLLEKIFPPLPAPPLK
ncbi:MAG: Asp-tRNA(Asn)/Glu-tRNA(Gln) amidotransferase subunit GatA [Deltaproteobacteria bacterium]|jgi:aspartyl-tRNA(Asn)/glutamyl-tRNA(Gln) amidotransferase subunit A|nr:Asp-tRNA(Asn)/Glu-tRNA(Gln) amidotransferase subunit GatA [Deltaproteobacteria bacterium]